MRGLLFWCVACVLLGVACDSPSDERRLVVTGSSTVAPLAAEIAKRFEAQNPGTRIDVQMGGSSRGVADAQRGLADIGMVSRALKEGERALTPATLARDGICVILHADNGVSGLTREQVVAIYTGAVTNWSEVGGVDAPITVVHKAEGRSTLELFLEHFGLENRDVEADVVIGDNEQGVLTVAGNRNAIGYVSIGTAEYDASHGASIKLVPVDGAVPSIANVAAGAFPLSRPLILVTKGPPTGLAAEFITFAQSEAVHDIVKEQHFVPIAP